MDCVCVASCGIGEQVAGWDACELHHSPLSPPFLFYQIYIKTLTGRKQALNFEPDNQVLSVKQALQEKEGIQVDQIKLIFSGKQLADDKTLEFYNINAGATIHMVLQLRGGGAISC